MMQPHKHQKPSFQRLRRSVSSRSSQESSDTAVHAFHYVGRRGQVQFRIQKVRTIFIQAPQHFTKPIPIGFGAQRMGDVSLYATYQFFAEHRIIRCNDFFHRLIRSSPPTPPFDAFLDTAQEHMETRHEMEMTPLQDPVVIGRDMLNTANTIGNQCVYAVADRTGYIADAPAPSIRRFPFSPQDRAQEYRILSIDASHGHQICRPSLALKAKPQRIDDQEEGPRWNMRWPGHAVQRGECCGVSLAQSGNRSMSALRSRGQRLLLLHDMGNTSQPALSRLSPSPFLPDRPGCSASATAFPTVSVPMNNRVWTPDFSVSCFHTRRIQDGNRQKRRIFLS